VGASRLVTVVTMTILVAALADGCSEFDPRVGELLRGSNSHLKKSAGYLREVAESGTKQQQLAAGQIDAESAAGLKALLTEARKKAEAELRATDLRIKLADDTIAGSH